MNEERYFNFPIWLLRDAFNDMKSVCDNIIDYAIYNHSQTLNGTKEERIKAAAKYFNVTLGTINGTVLNGQRLALSTPEKSVMTGLSHHMTFDFYQNDKTDLEKCVLLAFLAIKSILGKKSYCRITEDFLLCRMAGYSKKDEITEMPDELLKYKTRRRMNHIKEELKSNYGLKIYGRYTRGFFVSFKLSQEELIKVVEMKRSVYIDKLQKKEQKTLVNKVLTELYTTK